MSKTTLNNMGNIKLMLKLNGYSRIMKDLTRFTSNLVESLLKSPWQHINDFLNSNLVPQTILCFELRELTLKQTPKLLESPFRPFNSLDQSIIGNLISMFKLIGHSRTLRKLNENYSKLSNNLTE